MNEAILFIEILSYREDPPQRIGGVWWSKEKGLTTDSPALGELLLVDGVQVSSIKPDIVRPGDGRDRELFDHLPVQYTGLVRAVAPVGVEIQEGDAIK